MHCTVWLKSIANYSNAGTFHIVLLALKLENHPNHKIFLASKPFCHQNVSFWWVCFLSHLKRVYQNGNASKEEIPKWSQLHTEVWTLETRTECNASHYGCPVFEKRKWLPVQISYTGMYTHPVCHQVNPRALSWIKFNTGI